MRTYTLERCHTIAASPQQTFAFFCDPRNLEAITPAWLGFRIVSPEPITMGPGVVIEYRLHLHRVPLRWVARIDEWDPPWRFIDVQVQGPYRSWWHEHTFENRGGRTLVRDRVVYSLGFGPLGMLGRAVFVRKDLERIFDFRRLAVAELLSNSTRGAR